MPGILGVIVSLIICFLTALNIVRERELGTIVQLNVSPIQKWQFILLRPDALVAACAAADQPLTLRRQPGYDHSYYYIASFLADHLAHHAAALA